MSLFKGLPVITIPQGFSKVIAKREVKVAKKKGTIKNRGHIVIKCKNKNRNFYSNQVYKNSNIPLASSNWDQYYSRGDQFTIVAHSKLPAFEDSKDSALKFSDFDLHEKLVENLGKIGFERPTNIQGSTIPRILKGCNTMISAETGNGKTHTYLIPIVNQLLDRQKLSDPEYDINRPKTIILLPTRELAAQTKEMAVRLTEGMGLKVVCEIGGNKLDSRVMDPAPQIADILIGSFGTIKKLFSLHNYKRHLTTHIVLDEIDTLLDDSFSTPVMNFLKKFTIRVSPSGNPLRPDINSGTQITFVGATFPESCLHKLHTLIDNKSLYQVKSSNLHNLPKHVKHTFMFIGKHDRDQFLIQKVQKTIKQKKNLIIFTNRNESCYQLKSMFQELGIEVAELSSFVDRKWRVATLKRYMAGSLHVLISTDLISRGVNTCNTHCVINYKMPLFMSDYIHRAGRVGRVGSPEEAEVISFVTRYDKKLVKEIELSVRTSSALPNVNANIKKEFNDLKSTDNIE